VCAPHRARLHRPSSSARPSRQTHALLPASAGGGTANAALPEKPRSHNGRARIPPTACSCDVPMVASVFVRVPVQGGEGCSMATRAAAVWLPTRPDIDMLISPLCLALSICAAHRSSNREASACTRCARMACRVQWRASVSWRCLKTLGTHSALMPATCGDANEAQESNVRIH
jgi:hypothetical protein